jgi:stalled ribosome rescue protein Dom34
LKLVNGAMADKTTLHAAVWLDHEEAKIFHINPASFEVKKLSAPVKYLTRKAEEQGSHALSDRFFRAVAEGLQDAHEVLVVGPASAKLDFLRFVQRHDHPLADRILGVETLDHPTDSELAVFVRQTFRVKDRKLEFGLAP